MWGIHGVWWGGVCSVVGEGLRSAGAVLDDARCDGTGFAHRLKATTEGNREVWAVWAYYRGLNGYQYDFLVPIEVPYTIIIQGIWNRNWYLFRPLYQTLVLRHLVLNTNG